jgi:hypothetical protein
MLIPITDLTPELLGIKHEEMQSWLDDFAWRWVIAYDVSAQIELKKLRKRYECWDTRTHPPDRLFCLQNTWSTEQAIHRANTRLQKSQDHRLS